MKNVLIVDDEASFIMSLSDGLKAYSEDFNLYTAENGKEAIDILQTIKIDLVVTDLKMPVMDGFELLAYLANSYPTVPVIVMTAFGTPEIEEKIQMIGAIHYIEKPLDLKDLAEKIYDGLAVGSKGYIKGITLFSFLQLIELEKKTCTLTVKSKEKEGHLYFIKGVLLNAETDTLEGEDAAYEIVCWDNAEIEIDSICKKKKKQINLQLNQILMEGFKIKDEKNRHVKERRSENGIATSKGGAEVDSAEKATLESININKKEVNIMAVQDKLKEFASIDGFGGVALFTPTGEVLAMLEAQGTKANLKDIGVLANNVLINAQKASLDMGTGRGQLVHIVAEHANIIVRCLNEGTDALKSQPGKAHIHMILILTNDSSIGLAKMKIGSIIQALAEDFRL